MKEFTRGALRVLVHDSAAAMGEVVAEEFARIVRAELSRANRAAVVLASANSQLPFLRSLRGRDDVDWSRIEIFHMDEYVGMSSDHPASFRGFLRTQLVDHVQPAAFHGIAGEATDATAEMQRYAALLTAARPVLTVMGIGENGHLAFNEPPADFETPDVMQLVTLDERSRRQQVGEGHFASLDETPRTALTLTIPALLASRQVLVLVPEARKADAVRAALDGPISPSCPASVLQRAGHATLHLDVDSAALLHTTASTG